MARKQAKKKAAPKTAKKKTVKKRPAKKRTAQKKTAPSGKSGKKSPGDAVTVRMYCQGLGDCFLLSFPRKSGNKPFRVLIDCGVLQGTPDDEEKLTAVANNLFEETDGKIDLLIVTHEHWDHISGFSLAHTVFKKIQFDRVWLSWAENPQDATARLLKQELGKKKQKVEKALQALAGLKMSANGPQSDLERDLQSTRHVMQFFGPAATKKKNKRMSLGDTMDWLRGKVQGNDFCEPGECRTLTETDGVKVYILGPPKDPKLIRKMNPSGNQGYRHLAATASFSGAIEWLINSQTELPPGPFDDCFALSIDQAANDPFFRENYGFANDPINEGMQAWRKIDDDWLGSVGRFALQLDRAVNNTSLAVAFELSDGRTMIFPGDAQIGNWLSWDQVKFHDEHEKELPVVAKDLLHRAVFYKVGHHGSHNATRKEGGLEEMRSGNLVAMIPTDQQFAQTRKPPHDGWKMPFEKLYEALKEYTDQRIARADFNKQETENLVGSSSLSQAFLKQLHFAEQPLLAKQKDVPLYVEYHLPK